MQFTLDGFEQHVHARKIEDSPFAKLFVFVETYFFEELYRLFLILEMFIDFLQFEKNLSKYLCNPSDYFYLGLIFSVQEIEKTWNEIIFNLILIKLFQYFIYGFDSINLDMEILIIQKINELRQIYILKPFVRYDFYTVILEIFFQENDTVSSHFVICVVTYTQD